MSIEYMIELDCAPKQALGAARLLQLTKHKRQGDSLLEYLRGQGDHRSPSEIVLQTVRNDPSGTHTKQITLQDFLDAGVPLAPHEAACASCRANVIELPFGCYGGIPYPIVEQTESWLLSLLPDDLECTAGHFLQRAIADFEYDGAHVAAMREKGQTFFMSETSASAQWGGVQVTTDQVMHMLFYVGNLNPTHCRLISLFVGMIPHDVDPAALRDYDLSRATPPRGPDDAPQIDAFRSFFRAVANAAAAEVSVLVDA